MTLAPAATCSAPPRFWSRSSSLALFSSFSSFLLALFSCSACSSSSRLASSAAWDARIAFSAIDCRPFRPRALPPAAASASAPSAEASGPAPGPSRWSSSRGAAGWAEAGGKRVEARAKPSSSAG